MRLVTKRPIFPLLIVVLLFCCKFTFVAATSYAAETDDRGLAVVDKNRYSHYRLSAIFNLANFVIMTKPTDVAVNTRGVKVQAKSGGATHTSVEFVK